MPNTQIKDVPPEVHTALRQRAALTGQSLQEYLLAQLTETASRPTSDELLDRIAHRSGGSLAPDEAAAAVRDDRDRR